MKKADIQAALSARGVPFTPCMTVADLKLRLKTADIDVRALARADIEALTLPVLIDVLKMHGAALPAKQRALKADYVEAAAALNPTLVQVETELAEKRAALPVDVLRLVRKHLGIADRLRLSVALGDRDDIAAVKKETVFFRCDEDEERLQNAHVEVKVTRRPAHYYGEPVPVHVHVWCKHASARLSLSAYRGGPGYSVKIALHYTSCPTDKGDVVTADALNNDFQALLTAVPRIKRALPGWHNEPIYLPYIEKAPESLRQPIRTARRFMATLRDRMKNSS